MFDVAKKLGYRRVLHYLAIVAVVVPAGVLAGCAPPPPAAPAQPVYQPAPPPPPPAPAMIRGERG